MKGDKVRGEELSGEEFGSMQRGGGLRKKLHYEGVGNATSTSCPLLCVKAFPQGPAGVSSTQQCHSRTMKIYAFIILYFWRFS